MLESVGHEFIEDFFGCCESILAENGLLVLQVMNNLQYNKCLGQLISNIFHFIFC